MKNKLILGNSNEIIKSIPNKSVDCIYTDIPYLYNESGGGSSELAQRIVKTNEGLSKIKDGIDYSILDEFVRVMKKVNCFIWCSKLQILDIMNYFMNIENREIFFEILVWCKTNPTPRTKMCGYLI